jgi:hypothetical protein
MPTGLDNGHGSPKKLLRSVVARCSGGRASSTIEERRLRPHLPQRAGGGGWEREQAGIPLRVALKGPPPPRGQRINAL